jgi:hypothetical protein
MDTITENYLLFVTIGWLHSPHELFHRFKNMKIFSECAWDFSRRIVSLKVLFLAEGSEPWTFLIKSEPCVPGILNAAQFCASWMCGRTWRHFPNIFPTQLFQFCIPVNAVLSLHESDEWPWLTLKWPAGWDFNPLLWALQTRLWFFNFFSLLTFAMIQFIIVCCRNRGIIQLGRVTTSVLKTESAW